jgi:hypothetical protein
MELVYRVEAYNGSSIQNGERIMELVYRVRAYNGTSIEWGVYNRTSIQSGGVQWN